MQRRNTLYLPIGSRQELGVHKNRLNQKLKVVQESLYPKLMITDEGLEMSDNIHVGQG
jgi:hypothetical protein